jgi:hypothetical protein
MKGLQFVSLLKHNGPVVWEVAVCVGVGMSFCKVQIDGRKFSRPDGTVLTAESRLMGRICPVTVKLSKWLCKNHDNGASACSPIDFVSVAGFVSVHII